MELKGKYCKDCKIHIDTVEEEAISQIHNILSHPITDGKRVRIMPDVHSGSGCVIGYTAELSKIIIPDLVGVDIGCGMLSVNIGKKLKVGLDKADKNIRKSIPMGFDRHEDFDSKELSKLIDFSIIKQNAEKFVKKYNDKFNTNYSAPTYDIKYIENLIKKIQIEGEVFWSSIGSLGGGNHFIELGIDENKDNWITIHSGSRNFGLKVAKYHSKVAADSFNKMPLEKFNKERDKIINKTKKKKDISGKLKELKKKHELGIPRDQAYLKNEDAIDYCFDMIFTQYYASLNRYQMLNSIINSMKIGQLGESIESVHNYIDFSDMIIRKGAISSYKNQKMIIPFNMRDGILVCEGKSNEDWNWSAPHGAGRIMSRSKAKKSIKLENFQKTMKGIYSSSVCESTLDEAPFAYKSAKLIEGAIEPTATILHRIKPILNIKSK